MKEMGVNTKRGGGQNPDLGNLTLEQRARMLEELTIIRARTDLATYGKYVFDFEAARHHKVWIEALLDTRLRRLLFIAPPDHAKTTWIPLIYGSWIVGRDIETKVMSIGMTRKKAKQTSVAVRDTISKNLKFRKVFPGCIPDDEKWTEDEWRVLRQNIAKDPTYYAAGVDGDIYGSRVKDMFWDDVNNDENTKTELQREGVNRKLRREALSRILPPEEGGRLISVMTRWNEKDSASVMMSLKGVTVIHMPSIGYWELIERADNMLQDQLSQSSDSESPSSPVSPATHLMRNAIESCNQPTTTESIEKLTTTLPDLSTLSKSQKLVSPPTPLPLALKFPPLSPCHPVTLSPSAEPKPKGGHQVSNRVGSYTRARAAALESYNTTDPDPSTDLGPDPDSNRLRDTFIEDAAGIRDNVSSKPPPQESPLPPPPPIRGEEWRHGGSFDLIRDGSALWPSRYPKERPPGSKDDGLLDILARDPMTFELMYQGNTRQAAGNLFKRESFGYYKLADVRSGATPVHDRFDSWDTASKTETQNDYTAKVTIGVAGGRIYVLDVIEEKIEVPELQDRIIKEYLAWGTQLVMLEDKSSGIGIIQTLKLETMLPIVASRDMVKNRAIFERKIEDRARAVVGFVRAGRIFLPDDAAWTLRFLDHMAQFPTGTHDDIAAAFIQALLYLIDLKLDYVESALTTAEEGEYRTESDEKAWDGDSLYGQLAEISGVEGNNGGFGSDFSFL